MSSTSRPPYSDRCQSTPLAPSEASASVPSVTIRETTGADAEAITRIYNAGIAERIATFETRPRTTAEIEEKITRLPAHHAMLVAERAARGEGVGLRLVEALIEAARARGVWKLTSRIFPENQASLGLADRAGFRRVGTHERHARLDGEWRDVVVVERLIEENIR